MNLLIIGGTGNISTEISRILVERGDEVTLYNRGRNSISLLWPDGTGEQKEWMRCSH